MDESFYDEGLWGEDPPIPVCITHQRFLTCSGLKSPEPCVWSTEDKDIQNVRRYHSGR